jgi:hypothetical protein
VLNILSPPLVPNPVLPVLPDPLAPTVSAYEVPGAIESVDVFNPPAPPPPPPSLYEPFPKPPPPPPATIRYSIENGRADVMLNTRGTTLNPSLAFIVKL